MPRIDELLAIARTASFQVLQKTDIAEQPGVWEKHLARVCVDLVAAIDELRKSIGTVSASVDLCAQRIDREGKHGEKIGAELRQIRERLDQLVALPRVSDDLEDLARVEAMDVPEASGIVPDEVRLKPKRKRKSKEPSGDTSTE